MPQRLAVIVLGLLPILLAARAQAGDEAAVRRVYGGTDPGKGIDDDFAAVLIRKYDAKGEIETDDSQRAPLVSAEWHPVGIVGQIDRQTVIHTQSTSLIISFRYNQPGDWQVRYENERFPLLHRHNVCTGICCLSKSRRSST